MSNNSFKIKNSAVLTPKDLSTLVSPEAGEIACDINDSNKIKRYDAASSSWVEVGSGGVGSVDIMFVQDFESASLSSFTQTGLSLSTTNPLHGKVSALLTHQAAVNQSFKQVVAVDPKFRGQAMVLDLNIKSAASAGNVVIKVRDESNSADLIVSEALQLSNDVSGRRSSVSFTIPSTSSSISYTITALPEAGSPVTRIDDIVSYLGDVALLETSVEVPVMTAWQGYTPTFQGFGTPSAVEFEWRQVGQNVEIRGKFISGTPTAVEARVGLPGGLTSAGTSIIPSLQLVGKGNRNAGGTQFFGGVTFLIEPSVNYLTLSLEASSIFGTTKQNGNTIASSGEVVTVLASVPCSGLSATTTKTIPLTQSGLVQEADSYLLASGNAGQVITANVTDIPFIAVSNVGSDIQWNGASFTVINSGIFDISGQIRFAAIVADRTVDLYINGTQVSRLNVRQGVTGAFVPFSTSRFFNKNDIVSLRTSSGGTLINAPADHFISISHQGSLKQVSVSSDQKITIPTSELRFEGASTRGSTATAIVRFDTMAKLRGDAFTVESDAVLGTRITMKKAGLLNISTNLRQSSTSTYFAISKNQAVLTSIPASASEVLSFCNSDAGTSYESMSYSGFVNVGDIIRISANNNPTSDATQSLNLSFQEQDISVSVTNTLPQFSESDSSVRVNTANGYGSTASNKIRRFSSVVDNIGTDISYVDDPANGATFTVLTSGVYNVTYTDQFSAQCLMGLSKNASSLTSAIQSLSASQILATTNSVSLNQPESVSWQGYLNAGDIIRPHSEGTSAGTTTSAVNFTISKVGKPNVTGVNVTPFVNVPQPDAQSIESLAGTSTFGSTNTGVPVFAISKDTSNGIIAIDSTAAAGTSFRALKSCRVNISSSAAAATVGSFHITKNATLLTSASVNGIVATQSVPAGTNGNVSTEIRLDTGDILRIQRDSGGVNSNFSVILSAEALSDQILTAPETFSTDTAALSYKSSSEYTLATLQNAPVGSYITFTYAANTNTRTQTTTRPTQTDADMNTNGIQMFARTYNAVSTATQPAAVAIQIGKGLKGKSLDLYKSSGKATAGSLDYYTVGSGASGALVKDYNEVTGILVIDCGVVDNTVTSAHNFNFSDVSSQASGYLVINASKSPALTGVPLLQPRIATLSDVKASGSSAGGSTTTYSARTLNTMDDPTGIVTSLASNQFTLPAGEYYIEASAPTFGAVGDAKVKLRNISDSTDAIVGFSSYGTTNTMPRHSLSGKIVITSSKVFELQHRTATAVATNGFGTNNNFGDSEIYSVVKIQKIK